LHRPKESYLSCNIFLMLGQNKATLLLIEQQGRRSAKFS
jgi:hypothetical protein